MRVETIKHMQKWGGAVAGIVVLKYLCEFGEFDQALKLWNSDDITAEATKTTLKLLKM